MKEEHKSLFEQLHSGYEDIICAISSATIDWNSALPQDLNIEHYLPQFNNVSLCQG